MTTSAMGTATRRTGAKDRRTLIGMPAISPWKAFAGDAASATGSAAARGAKSILGAAEATALACEGKKNGSTRDRAGGPVRRAAPRAAPAPSDRAGRGRGAARRGRRLALARGLDFPAAASARAGPRDDFGRGAARRARRSWPWATRRPTPRRGTRERKGSGPLLSRGRKQDREKTASDSAATLVRGIGGGGSSSLISAAPRARSLRVRRRRGRPPAPAQRHTRRVPSLRSSRPRRRPSRGPPSRSGSRSRRGRPRLAPRRPARGASPRSRRRGP